MRRNLNWLALIVAVFISGSANRIAVAAELRIVDDWKVNVHMAATGDRPELSRTIEVQRPQQLVVTGEKHAGLPLYNPQGPQYARGDRLVALYSERQTAPDLLVPESVVVRAGFSATDETFVRGRDYEFENRWGGIGRLDGGHIQEGQPVFIDYHYYLSRIDTIFLDVAGEISYRPGEPRAESPLPPSLKQGEQRLANLWIPTGIKKLTIDNLFPILETSYPEPEPRTPSIAEERIPRAMAKLRSGAPLRILAWGDSVTEGAYLEDPDHERWQAQFVSRLKQRFPKARIELITEAWGGRSTRSYLGVPAGQPHNFQETVLDAHPDLIISEFVNDAGLKPADVEQRYGKLLLEFQKIGAEWILLTPHYVRPDWMGLDRQRDIDDDPRPYVQGLREFAQKHDVALADASLRYGRLWRQGLPYNTLMVNCINHPDPRGLKIFADALLELFPPQ